MKFCNRYLYTLLFLMASSFTFAQEAKDITVSAAISLKNAFEELGKIYEAKYNKKCTFNFGTSGDLSKQISNGAPVDVFASAAQKDMDELEKAGLIVKETRTNFVTNEIVLIVPTNSKLSIKSFEDLGSDAVKKIAVGNPKSVPAGRYAEDIFSFYKMLESNKNKFIYTENVRQVLDYVSRGEVDAGLVYSTDAKTK